MIEGRTAYWAFLVWLATMVIIVFATIQLGPNPTKVTNREFFTYLFGWFIVSIPSYISFRIWTVFAIEQVKRRFSRGSKTEIEGGENF